MLPTCRFERRVDPAGGKQGERTGLQSEGPSKRDISVVKLRALF